MSQTCCNIVEGGRDGTWLVLVSTRPQDLGVYKGYVRVIENDEAGNVCFNNKWGVVLLISNTLQWL